MSPSWRKPIYTVHREARTAVKMNISMASGAPSTNLRERLSQILSGISELEHIAESECRQRIDDAVRDATDQARREAAEQLAEQLKIAESASLQRRDQAVREATDQVRRESVEQLNQAARRMRQSEDIDQLSATLADACSRYCNCAAVFSVNANIVKSESMRGVPGEMAQLEFPAHDAAAFQSAIQTKDPVIAMNTAAEISPTLEAAVAGAGLPAEERICVVPLVVRDKAVGLVYAAGIQEVAAIELLAGVAAATLESRMRAPEPEVVAAPQLVSIGGLSGPPKEKRGLPSWDDLAPEERQQHLRAQRFARRKAAEMVLEHLDAIREGRHRSDVYDRLRDPIDRAREEFRKEFMSTGTMVDYVHLELVRTLANEDAALLGKNYPGPLV